MSNLDMVNELEEQLREAYATIDAIRSGSVDSVVVRSAGTDQIYALRTADRTYRLIVEGMNEGAAIVSADGLVLYANPSLARMSSCRASDLAGTPLVDLIRAQDQGWAAEVLAAVPDGPRGAELELRDGVPVAVSISSFEMDGRVLRCVVMTDLTDRRSTESELARRAAELEQVNRELARSNDDLAQFAYVTSHDLSEPLRAIAGPLGILARNYSGALDADADEFIGFAVDGCERMQKMISALLAYSRLERGEIRLVTVDCNEMIRKLTVSLGAVVAETGASVQFGDLPTVRAEPAQLDRVFQNLITNSLKFTRPGESAVVTVEATKVDRAWRFTVSDNGIGIPAQHREFVFGMFKRLHGRQDYSGTGIGLAIVKKIVERLGGEVGVSDTPDGIGTSVWFTIPDQWGPAGGTPG